MTAFRLRQGGKSLFGAFALLLAGLASPAPAAQPFPFDQTLRLDIAPMRPVKRVPILTVARNGEATIGLWCKTLRARVQLSNSDIRIEPGPIPQDLPRYMVDGQCSDARLQADLDTLTALIQVTGWRARGDALMLIGPKTFRFRTSSN
jgi:hypothetical protein